MLRWLATLVAFVGVLSALMALTLEREREVAVLRAQGMTGREVWGLVEFQTGAIGLLAGLLALPLGLAMALALIHVVNRRAFGWTMHASVDPPHGAAAGAGGGAAGGYLSGLAHVAHTAGERAARGVGVYCKLR